MNLLKPKYEIKGTKYVVMGQIGEGAFAFVYRVTDSSGLKRVLGPSNATEFALKRMICQSEEQMAEARKEIHLMASLNNMNVIRLIASEIKMSGGKIRNMEALLLMPLYDCSLQDRIDKGPGFPNSAFSIADVIRISTGFVCGLLTIHNTGYRHCDFKPANVLLRRLRGSNLPEDEEVVVTDLGSASELTTIISSRSQAMVIFQSI